MKKLAFILTLSLLALAGCGDSKKNTQSDAQTTETQPEEKPGVKFELFNDINKTRELLSDNGIGQLNPWISDQMGGFMSITDYHTLANSKSNIAYYLESENENYIQTLKLVLNINDNAEKKAAVAKFKETATATFKSLSAEAPAELMKSIDSGKNFEEDTEKYSIKFEVVKTKIETYQLVIETKI